MQHDFPDLAEDVPEQDLLLGFGPEVFDDYWGELEDMAVGNSEGLATGSLPASVGIRLFGHDSVRVSDRSAEHQAQSTS